MDQRTVNYFVRGSTITVLLDLILPSMKIRRYLYYACNKATESKAVSRTGDQCYQKKSPNVYKSCLKMISLEK